MTDYDKVAETRVCDRGVVAFDPSPGWNPPPQLTSTNARDTVTMGVPLTPWGHTRFHKTLALHIHDAMRPAGHSYRAANYGVMDNEDDAKAWDATNADRR
jgi:hypothetical protein